MPDKTTWRSRIVGHDEVPPDQLLANPLNWRIHPQFQRRALVQALDVVGWVDSVIVNRRTGHLVDGHLRVLAAMERGEPVVPVDYVDLSEDEERLVLATLDPLATLAIADGGVVSQLLDGVQVGDGPLQELLNRVRALGASDAAGLGPEPLEPEPEPAPEDEAEALEARWAVAPGQLWTIPASHGRGDHRLFIGDALDDGDMAALMGGVMADMVFADPPYAIYGSSTGVSADVADSSMVEPFFRQAFGAMRKASRRFAHLYVCCDWRSYPVLYVAAGASRVEVKNLIVWAKDSAGLGSLYRNSHEFIMFCVNNWRTTAVMKVKGDSGHRTVPDSNVWHVGRVTNKRAHNAQKPLDLVARAIANSTRENEIVLDPFIGTGTTILAADRLGRVAYGMEKKTRFAAVALQRLADAGLEPRLAEGDGHD